MNILANIYNFDEPWAHEVLKEIFHEAMRVTICPLSYHEGWINNTEEWQKQYGQGQKYYQELVRPFLAYGIQEEQIEWVNYFEDTRTTIQEKFEKSDLIFFTGGLPDWMLQRIHDLEMNDLIQNFDGIVMGCSAGALIQMQLYHITPEEDYPTFQFQYGLSLLSGFDLECHYEENSTHLQAMITAIESHGMPLLVFSNQGGFVIEKEEIIPMGDAMMVMPEELDELKETLNYLREKEGK